MCHAWQMIDDILAGAHRVRAAGQKYLPKYEAEGEEEYKRRLTASPWRPEFRDALRGLSSKPFSREVRVDDAAPEIILGTLDAATKKRSGGLVDDIDARGNNLTAFSRVFFEGAIAKGMRGILVDYPPVAEGSNLDDIRRRGVRPYWVDVHAEDVIAFYTAAIEGKETVVHLRIRECAVERDGYDEVVVNRIREFDRPKIIDDDGTESWGATVWRLWKQVSGGERSTSWELEAEGLVRRGGKTDIPFAVLWTGDRRGEHEVIPPLLDIADMQIELYRSLSRKEEVLTYAGSPMLAGNGLSAPEDGSSVQVGPKRVLYAPPGYDGAATGWEYVQPDAANITEIRNDIEGIINDIRRLGMQPLTQKAGGVTATATSVEAAKAHSQVEAWALALKDVLEQAFVFTAEWLGIADTIAVSVDTDFGVGEGGTEEAKVILEARKEAQISQETFWDEMQRRGILGPQFDSAEEKARIAVESPPFDPDGILDPGIDPVPAG